MLMGSVGVVAVTVLLLVLKISSEALQREKFVVQPHPVQFNEEPHNWTVTEGASVNLTCNTTVVQVIGYINENTTPLPQIKWFHNNVMIDSSGHFTINNHGIDTSILTIRNVTSLEQGEYYCVVNEWVKPDGDWWTKTRSKSGHITVISNNSILSVNTENHVVLSCVEPTAVIPDSGVVWIKDGVEMSENMMEYSSNLILNKVSKDHSGHYKYVERMNKSNTLCSYTLTVQTTTIHLRTPLKFHNMKENHYIKIRSDADVFGCRESPVNQSVIMNCNADGHQTMKWYKNGELLDLNSEGTMFNQTTGDLVIRREDACELLGVYQCFASNEIDTVHMSTRVLPLGWPNRPGRPELVSYTTHTNGFRLKLKIHNPNYLGGLDMDAIVYDVYMSDAGSSIVPRYINTYNSSLDTVGIDLTSKVRILGVDSLSNVYYLTVQLIIRDMDLVGIAASPTGSPFLVISVLCDLVDHPPAIIEHTCDYSDGSDMMMTYNISWQVEGSTLNYVYADHIYLWDFSVNCHYPNDSLSIQPIRYYTSSNKRLLQVPKDSYCVVSVVYNTHCGLNPASTAFLSCNNSTSRDIDNNNSGAHPTTSNSAKTDAKNPDLLIELFILLGVVTLMLIIITAIAIFICCVHFRRKKERKAGKNLAHVVVQ